MGFPPHSNQDLGRLSLCQPQSSNLSLETTMTTIHAEGIRELLREKSEQPAGFFQRLLNKARQIASAVKARIAAAFAWLRDKIAKPVQQAISRPINKLDLRFKNSLVYWVVRTLVVAAIAGVAGYFAGLAFMFAWLALVGSLGLVADVFCLVATIAVVAIVVTAISALFAPDMGLVLGAKLRDGLRKGTSTVHVVETPMAEEPIATVEPAAAVKEAAAMKFTPDAIHASDIDACIAFFEKRHSGITRMVEFRPEWGNEENAYEGLLNHPTAKIVVSADAAPVPWADTQCLVISVGEVVKAFTPTFDRMIIVGTRVGPIVVFERTQAPGTFVYNTSTELAQLEVICACQRLGLSDLRELVGTNPADGEPVALNLGQWLEVVHDAMHKSAPAPV